MPVDGDDLGEPAGREKLFVYLTTSSVFEYRSIMDVFAGPLLADLSAAEVAQQLTERGLVLSIDEVTDRCEKLEGWGNLVRGVRDARVPTVRDFLRSRSRFQASKLGGRVHRDAEAVLAAGDGAQEVARELLDATVLVLDRIIKRIRASSRGVRANVGPRATGRAVARHHCDQGNRVAALAHRCVRGAVGGRADGRALRPGTLVVVRRDGAEANVIVQDAATERVINLKRTTHELLPIDLSGEPAITELISHAEIGELIDRRPQKAPNRSMTSTTLWK